jgi:hypothetical protein
VHHKCVGCRSGTRYRREYAMLRSRGAMGMRSALGMMHAVPMSHPVMQQLCREAVGANLEGKWVVCRRHEPRRHERTKRQRNEQDAGDKLATALTARPVGMFCKKL